MESSSDEGKTPSFIVSVRIQEYMPILIPMLNVGGASREVVLRCLKRLVVGNCSRRSNKMGLSVCDGHQWNRVIRVLEVLVGMLRTR